MQRTFGCRRIDLNVNESGARPPVAGSALVVRDGEHAHRIVRRDPVNERKWEPTEQPATPPAAHRAAGLRAFCCERDNAPDFGDELRAEVRNAWGIVLGRLSRVGQRIWMKRDYARRTGQRRVS